MYTCTTLTGMHEDHHKLTILLLLVYDLNHDDPPPLIAKEFACLLGEDKLIIPLVGLYLSKQINHVASMGDGTILKVIEQWQ